MTARIVRMSGALDVGVFGARGIPSTYSGYETFLTTLLPALAARGHRVTMYCRTGEVESDMPYEGVERVILPAIAGKHFNTLSHGAVASARASMGRHDALLVTNVANAVFCKAALSTGQRVVLNTDGQEWLRGKWGRAGRWFFHTSAKIAERCATALVSDCQAMADIYAEQFGAASTVIPYCFPSIEHHRTEALKRFGVEPGQYVIVAGRLNPENNIDRIAEQYTRSSMPMPLLVLGAANYDSPVLARIRELESRDRRVRFVGHVGDRAEWLDLLGSAAAYLHGHSVGGMNPSLVEAMHAGALVCVLDTPFNRETVGDGGLVFRLEGPARLGPPGLVTVLDQVRTMPAEDDRRRRAAAAERVRTAFGIAPVVDAYEELLRAAAAAGPRDRIAIPTQWSRAAMANVESEPDRELA